MLSCNEEDVMAMLINSSTAIIYTRLLVHSVILDNIYIYINCRIQTTIC